MFFRIWLVGLMVLMVNGVNAQREGFSASISGKVTNSGDYGVSGAEVQIFYYTLEESNGLTSPEKISGREPIKTFKTNEDGSFGGALTMDDFQKLRAMGGMRDLKMAVKVSKEDFVQSFNFVEAARNRSETGLQIIIPTVVLFRSDEAITAVEIKTRAVEMKGDTTEINASNFKTNPDASAEDLVKKMPGVTSNNGEVEAQGEKVKRVLIDGKPYFGDDPKAALKNVPADVISKVQIFDAQSERSAFTGFDDGNTTKTMNIITKMGFKKGRFGKFYGGLGRSIDGTGDLLKYQAGATYNTFNGDRRWSLLFQTNNINEQNFAVEDIMGALGMGGNRGGGMGMFRGAGNFFSGTQTGVVTTAMLGLNYADKWSKKLDVSGSYFLSATENLSESNTERWFVSGSQSNVTYLENNSNTSRQWNHRLNGRITWDVDSVNKVFITPRLTLQQSNNFGNIAGNSFVYGALGSVDLLSAMNNLNGDTGLGYNLQAGFEWLHAIKSKKGRSISLEVTPGINNGFNLGNLNYINAAFGLGGFLDTSVRAQQTQSGKNRMSLSAELEYTEPLDSLRSLSFEYQLNVNQNSSERLNYLRNGVTGEWSVLDTLLSSKLINGYSRQALGGRYQYKKKAYEYDFGFDLQVANLDATQYFPREIPVIRTFYSFLPRFTFRKGDWRSSNMRLFYRTSNSAPSLEDLQDVIDNSNPLQLRTGNPNLVQDFTHNLTLRYFKMDMAKNKNFFAMLMGTAKQNAITTLTQLAGKDGSTYVVGDSTFSLKPGSQLTRPINMNGAYNARLIGSFGRPFFKGKIFANANGGITYVENPSMIQMGTSEAQANISRTPGANLGLTLGSNISERVDFTLAGNINYSQVRNSLQTTLDQDYFIQNASFRANFMPKGKWVISSDITLQSYSGLSNSFNQTFFLWNASVGRKFGKKNQWDFRLMAYDLLNQNRSITRNVTQTYFEDVRTNVLTRYVMFNLTYNLRSLNGNEATEEMKKMRMMMPMGPGGHGRGIPFGR